MTEQDQPVAAIAPPAEDEATDTTREPAVTQDSTAAGPDEDDAEEGFVAGYRPPADAAEE